MMRSVPVFLIAGLLVLVVGCGGGDVAPEPMKAVKPAQPGIAASKDAVDRAHAFLADGKIKMKSEYEIEKKIAKKSKKPLFRSLI